MTATFTLVIENSMPRASLATIGLGGHLEQREFTSGKALDLLPRVRSHEV